MTIGIPGRGFHDRSTAPPEPPPRGQPPRLRLRLCAGMPARRECRRMTTTGAGAGRRRPGACPECRVSFMMQPMVDWFLRARPAFGGLLGLAFLWLLLL